MNTVILQHVARPVRVLYLAPAVLAIVGAAGILPVLFLALLGFQQAPLVAVAVWAILYPFAVLITVREPHIDSYIVAWLERSPRRTPNVWKTPGSRHYVA